MLLHEPDVIRISRINLDAIVSFLFTKKVMILWSIKFEIPHFINLPNYYKNLIKIEN